MRVLLLDNRDSFTFNLAQAFGELGAAVDVVDASAVQGADDVPGAPDLVCVGPGPRGPAELPALVRLVGALAGRVPLLGVCLGLQALVRAEGGEVGRAREALHGRRAPLFHDGRGVFSGLPSPLSVMRYHSLVATRVPASLTVTARDDVGQVMAVRDEARRLEAVQFHPESIGTEGGLEILANALALAGPRPPVRHRPGSIPPPRSGPVVDEPLAEAVR